MKKLFLSIFIFNFVLSIFSQQILDSSTSSWSHILPGKTLCQSQNTSYGFLTLDEARILTAFRSDGSIRWEKTIERGRNPFFKVLQNDFVLLINKDGYELKLLNPTGNELWTITSEHQITSTILPGRDGRFFLKGIDFVECYGLNGIRKWSINFDSYITKFPMVLLNDGSILIIYNGQKADISSKGVRISPFGEILEEITFESYVKNLSVTNNGVLISFTNGHAGLISVQKNKIKNLWTIDNQTYKPEDDNLSIIDYYFISDFDTNIFYCLEFSDKLILYNLNENDGKIKNTFTVSQFSNPIYKYNTDSGIILSNNSQVQFYNYSGKLLWNGLFKNSKSKNSDFKFLYNDQNYLLIFSSDWNINAFKISQNTKGKNINNTQSKTNYHHFLSIDTDLFENYLMAVIDDDISNTENIELLQNGDYGIKEKKLLEKLLSGCKAYENLLYTKNSRTGAETTVFERDNAGLERMIAQMPLFGTDSFSYFIAYVIKYETNRTILNSALSSINTNGYDPDGKILENLYLLAKKTDIRDSTIAIEVCDAVYSICRIMGKPAFNKQGKEILTTFIYPKYNVKIKEYARETLKKISELDL